jgi:hypothetical protein
LRKELRDVRNGSFRLWEDGRCACGFPPEWNRNVLSGRRRDADRHWTDEGEQPDDDIKGLWELSRFAVAFRLARVYVLSGDDAAPETFWRLVESWLDANPPNAGPQWVSAQEVALRAMAWIFALRAFARSPATTPERVRRLLAGLEAHGRRIEATTAYARAQNNNHLISEAAGLYTIGLLFPALPRASSWHERGRGLLAESAAQFFPDGGYIQHSHNYHRLALQLYLWTMRLAELDGRPFPEEMYRCVDRSIGLLLRIVDPATGTAPNFGHNDGALFLPLNDCDYRDYRPLLQTLSLWRTRRTSFTDGPWNEDAAWMLGPDAFRRKDRAPAAGRSSKGSFSAARAGLFILEGRESRAVIRCARFGERPAHSDQLHADLWRCGENIAVDAGSYLYSGVEPWRNSLARAGVHNTVTVDGRDPMRRRGRFLWTDTVRGEGAFTGENRWQGTHDGYRGMGVVHRRTVEPTKNGGWIVTDEILGEGPHRARLHWLIPDYPWKWIAAETKPEFRKILSQKTSGGKDGFCAGLRIRTPAGEFLVGIRTSQNVSWSLYRAGVLACGEAEEDGPVPQEIRGWRSLYYADKTPALSLAGTVDGVLPVRFITVWIPLGRNG